MSAIEKIPMKERVACSFFMSSAKMKKAKRQFSGMCPNWSAVRVDGKPLCAGHAPAAYEQVSRS